MEAYKFGDVADSSFTQCVIGRRDDRMPGGDKKIVELRPDIYQIRGVRPGSHVYLIKGRRKNVMIDTVLAGGLL
jgi:hypothetical protein